MRDEVDWVRVLAYFHYTTARSNRMTFLTPAEAAAYNGVVGQVWTRAEAYTAAHTKQLEQILQVLAFVCDDRWQT